MRFRSCVRVRVWSWLRDRARVRVRINITVRNSFAVRTSVRLS
jgi:hypothetical protein